MPWASLAGADAAGTARVRHFEGGCTVADAPIGNMSIPARRTLPGGGDAESLLRSVIEATTDGILVVDRAGRIALANERFRQMWRIPREVLDAGDDAAALASVMEQLADPDAFLAGVHALYDSPSAESFDTLLFKDGRVFERYSRPQRVGSEIVGRVWGFRDVTDRERAQRALAESEARHRSLVEELPAITYLEDIRNEESFYLSPQTRSMLGYEPEEFDGLDAWFAAVHPDDRDAYIAETRRCVAAVEPFRGTYRMVHRNGDTVWVREHENILPGRDGRPAYRQGTVFDVSTEVTAAAQLRRAEGLYRGLVEQLPAVTYLWSLGGGCQYVSPQVERVFGCTAADFAAGAWAGLIAADDLDRVRAEVADAHAAHRGARVEYRLRHAATGEERWMVEQTAILAMEEGDLVQGLIIDRTEHVLAERALRRSEADRQAVVESLVRAADDERSRIATDLHDDTVQVLAASLLTTDQLRRDLARRGADEVSRVDRLREVLADAMERTRRLMFDLSPQALQASGVTAAVAELAGAAAAEGGFAATVDGVLPRYPAQAESVVYRTLREAITNVRKHARCSRLEVSMSERDGRIHCVVADDGVGFSPGSEAARADARLHFGLRSAAERVRLAGGTLTVVSVPGEGTAVTLEMPVD